MEPEMLSHDKVKIESGMSLFRGKKRVAATPPAPYTLLEYEAEAQYQRDLALLWQKVSFDTVQPALNEFAERWSCRDLDIIVIPDDDEAQEETVAMPATAVKEDAV